MIRTIFSNKLLPRVLIQVLPPTIIVLLAIAYFAAQIVNETTLTERSNRLQRIAVQSSTAVALRLNNIIAIAETLAANDLIVNSIVDTIERDRYILTLFQSLRVPGSADAHLSLTDYRGRVIASNTPGANYTDLPWIATAMEGKRVVKINASGMIVAAPILIAGASEGAIVIEYGKNALADLFKMPIQAEAYSIETSDGSVIHSSNTVFTSPGKSNHLSSTDNEWISASTEVTEFSNLNLYVGDTMESALAPVKQEELFLLLAILLSIVAVTIGIVITAVKVINPIIHFMKGVKHVGDSAELTYRMKPFGSDEFQMLTKRFNTMLSHVESMTTSRDYVDSLLNSMNEFMLVVSPGGEIQRGNRALEKFLECRVEELATRDITSFISGAWDELTALAGSEKPPVERRLINHNSDVIPVLVSVSLLRQGGKSSENLILVLNDITSQILAKEEHDRYVEDLERSNSDLEQFAYVASHDLKAPLRAIDKLAQFIDEDSFEALSEDSRSNIKLLRGRVGRLDSLLGGLLRYAQTGRDEEDIALVDTRALVSEVVELINPLTSIRVNISNDLPHITCNRTPLQQIFHNLIGNAIKHHDLDDGTIEISSRESDSHIEFKVSDDGPGISEKYHTKIFQMFQTLKRRDEVEGSGIGLAVVEKLVRNNGGKITVNSSAGERGATFCFTWKKHKHFEEEKNAA